MLKRRLHILLLVLVAMAVYANSLPNSFNFDDAQFVVANSAVHGFSLHNLKAVFTSVPNAVEYLPVRDLTYMLDYELWKLNPLGYHISNLFYFVLALIALYFLFLRIFLMIFSGHEDAETSAGRAAFIAALIYAIHPVHVESVACISQRKDILSGLFYFTGLFLYIESWKKPGGRYLLSLLMFLLAGLSKMTVVIMPVSVLLLELYFAPQEINSGKRPLRTIPFFVLAAALTVLGIYIARLTGVYTMAEAGLSSRIAGFFEVVLINIKMLFDPYPLVVWHQFDMPAGFLSGAIPALSIAAVAALVYLVFRFRKTRKALSFGFAWMLTSMVPVSGLFPTTVIVAERYMFLPSAGFCLAAGWGIFRLLPFLNKGVFSRLPAWAVGAGAAWALAMAVAFPAITVERNMDWKDKITLYTADLAHHPDLVKTYICLGKEYINHGDFQVGLAYLLRAKKLDPSDFEYDFYTAYYLYKTGQPDFALTVLNNLRSQLHMEVVDVDYLAGMIYQGRGDISKAKEFYLRAAHSGFPLGVYMRGQALAALNRLNAK